MRHGGNVWQGNAPDEWLDYSANVRPDGPPEWVREAMRAGLSRARYYPDPAQRAARAALEAARSELEMLRAEVERFRAGEQARMAADEKARRRAEVERRFEAAAGEREFLHEYVRKGLLADFAAALEDAANAGKSDTEVFSALTREKNCFAAQNPPPPLPAPEAAELERASGGEAFRALPLYEQFLFAQREPERARRYLAE